VLELNSLPLRRGGPGCLSFTPSPCEGGAGVLELYPLPLRRGGLGWGLPSPIKKSADALFLALMIGNIFFKRLVHARLPTLSGGFEIIRH
jgi:hypothetical protein